MRDGRLELRFVAFLLPLTSVFFSRSVSSRVLRPFDSFDHINNLISVCSLGVGDFYVQYLHWYESQSVRSFQIQILGQSLVPKCVEIINALLGLVQKPSSKCEHTKDRRYEGSFGPNRHPIRTFYSLASCRILLKNQSFPICN